MAHVKIGVLVPTRGELIRSPAHPDFENILRMAERIEEEGYHSVWVGDSVTAKPRFEALTSLGAIAARTKKARLGTAVLLSGLRNPVVLGHQVATLDVISKGRIILGVGVGGGESKNLISEFPASGVEYRKRAELFELGLETMKKIWTENNISMKTPYFELDDISVEPKPVQKPHPPIWIAGAHFGQAGERQLARIARLGDGFVSTLITPEEYRSTLGRIRRMAREMGRKPSGIDSCLYMSVNLNRSGAVAAREANRFLADYYGYTFWGDRWGPFGPSAGLIQYIQSFVDAGVGTFVVRFASNDQEGQLDTFTREVLPSFR
ncbi:MAG: LLM class flavin-dependent oxidoreductase [Thaumarchaeota archaeon]|nr:LLM class flavin-dependent oxidoreductase [Nitrososphaerota archaeon]